ncbi:MAG: ATP-binding domain-containing protein, partial [Alloprevotella tannerae]|nr:ATP-binding domain-containing protein [Alloprevotella tannerae]
YYNALQIKYAYAVTCHKAQGGQWERVFVDQGYVTDEMMGDNYLRWLYTAFTRTTDRLYLVNWPEEQQENLSE